MKIIRPTISTLCLLLLTGSIAFAQLTGGSMTGTVTDSSGGVVAKARVTATHVTSGRVSETATTSEGLYVLPSLEVGPYNVAIEAQGFKRVTLNGVVVAVGVPSVADAKLEAGNLTDTVTIAADATQLQSTTTEIGVSFSPKLFNDAPVSAGGLRNMEAFVSFQPGVTYGAGSEGGISGGARRAKEILLDGANMTNPESGGVIFNGYPAFESIGEFRLINNTFAAEYGRTGGGIESFVTKSGGNQFHGNVFDFHTSSALNAADWAGKASSTAANPVFRKIPFHGNNYGATLGGPIFLPKKFFGPLGGYN